MSLSSSVPTYDPHIESALNVLGSAGFKVFAPFQPGPRTYRAVQEERVSLGCVVDTETTSSDVSRARIVQLAIVPFVYDNETGAVFAINPGVVALEDPGIPCDPEAESVHGITGEQLMEKHFDDASLRRVFAEFDLVIAHNAAFDRPLIERRFPALQSGRWMCSYRDINWKAMGYDSSKLGSLLQSHCGEWFDGHDALDDCYALAHILATANHEGTPPLRDLLATTQRQRIRVFAINSPFNKKNLLKQRGYAWNDASAVDRVHASKTWWKEIFTDEMDAERDWLCDNVYVMESKFCPWQTVPIDAATRFLR